jgi:hypothetical protein
MKLSIVQVPPGGAHTGGGGVVLVGEVLDSAVLLPVDPVVVVSLMVTEALEPEKMLPISVLVNSAMVVVVDSRVPDVVDKMTVVLTKLQLEVCVAAVVVRSVVEDCGLHSPALMPGNESKAKTAAVAICFVKAIEPSPTVPK